MKEVVEEATAAGLAEKTGAAPSFVRSVAASDAPPVLVSASALKASTAYVYAVPATAVVSVQDVAVAASGAAQPPEESAAPLRRTRKPRLQPEAQPSFQADGAGQETVTPVAEQGAASVAVWMPAKETPGFPPPQLPRKRQSTHSG